jgi:hypothetical protein
MAIQVADVYTIPSFGIQLANLFFSFKGKYTLTKITQGNNSGNYQLVGTYEVRTVNDMNKAPIYVETLKLTLTPDQLAANMFTLLYNALKAKFKVTTDV